MCMLNSTCKIAFVAACLLAFSARAETPAPKHDSGEPIQINSDTLEVIQPQAIAIFRGNVIAIQGDTRIRSDVMTVHYVKKEGAPGAGGASSDPAQNRIQKIDVDGNVVVTNPTEAANGDRGFYDVDRKQIYLFSNVVLTRGKNILKGDTLVYDLVTEKSVINSPFHPEPGITNGRVRALFVPAEKPAENKDNKPQTNVAPQNSNTTAPSKGTGSTQ